MKLLDANILLYAYDTSSSHHETCRAWLESAFNADEMIALPWQTVLAFVRISTNPRAVKKPLSSAKACAIVDTWLERPNVIVVNAADRFWNILRQQIFDAMESPALMAEIHDGLRSFGADARSFLQLFNIRNVQMQRMRRRLFLLSVSAPTTRPNRT